jgi:NitT/TauT family transport system permease protein
VRIRWEYILALLFILVVWQLFSWIAGDIVIAGPLTVFAKVISEAQTATFWKHIGSSSYRIIAALGLAFVTAVPLGLFLGLSKKVDRFAKPLIYMSYPVPKVVLLPVVMLIFGIGDVSKIIMLWMILFFQLLITTRDSARGVSRAARISLLSLGGSQYNLFTHVIWPACLPSVLTALRITTGTVVAVLFLIESIGTNWGMGYYIIDAWGRADISQIFVGIVVLAAIGVILYEIFDIFERSFCKWIKL